MTTDGSVCAYCGYEVMPTDATCFQCWPGLRPKDRPAPTKPNRPAPGDEYRKMWEENDP